MDRPEYNMLLILPIMLCSYSPYFAYYSLPLFPNITHYSLILPIIPHYSPKIILLCVVL